MEYNASEELRKYEAEQEPKVCPVCGRSEWLADYDQGGHRTDHCVECGWPGEAPMSPMEYWLNRYSEHIIERIADISTEVEKNLGGSQWITEDGEAVEAADRGLWLDMKWLLESLEAANLLLANSHHDLERMKVWGN